VNAHAREGGVWTCGWAVFVLCMHICTSYPCRRRLPQGVHRTAGRAAGPHASPVLVVPRHFTGARGYAYAPPGRLERRDHIHSRNVCQAKRNNVRVIWDTTLTDRYRSQFALATARARKA